MVEGLSACLLQGYQDDGGEDADYREEEVVDPTLEFQKRVFARINEMSLSLNHVKIALWAIVAIFLLTLVF